MTEGTLTLGTRRSALARAQSERVAAALTAATGRPVKLVEIVTEGDTNLGSLTSLGGTGVFASALREGLLGGRVDLAVHSLKDLPTAPEPGLVVAAIPPREDPRDCVVARDGLTLGELPPGATVGTGSPRRAAQVRALGLGHEVVDVRGNVDTRMKLVADGVVDAVVLARAGLLRLGLTEAATEVLDPTQMLPAPGQGALAVECRADRDDLIDLLASLDDAATRAAVTAERSVLAALEAGCSAPVGALADVAEDGFTEPELYLRAVVAAVDGSTTVRLSMTGAPSDAAVLGKSLARRMIEDGAADLMGERIP
jgi:hydroxymethylbilane synthase